MRRNMARHFPARQRGATLVIALLILVLIMMIGITAVTTSNTQYKLAGNLQFEDSAMNNAEAAVTGAESWLNTSTAAVPPVPHYLDPGFTTAGATPELLPIGASSSPLTMAWSDANSKSVVDNAGNSNPAQRYIIQMMSTSNLLQGSSAAMGAQQKSPCSLGVNTYLITGRGTSARGASKFVQSFYSVCIK
jgi:Tfp pilus assembly protein PilX